MKDRSKSGVGPERLCWRVVSAPREHREEGTRGSKDKSAALQSMSHRLKKGSRLLHFTVPTLNTSALLIVLNAGRGKDCATQPSGDSSRISSVHRSQHRSQQSWRAFRNPQQHCCGALFGKETQGE